MSIDLTIMEERLDRASAQAKEQALIIPTYAQMKDPALISESVKQELSTIGLWDLHPRNLFRISWNNQPQETGVSFGKVVAGLNRQQASVEDTPTETADAGDAGGRFG